MVYPCRDPAASSSQTVGFPGDSLVDLELMHHYSVSTCHSFGDLGSGGHLDAKSYFRVEIPQLAMRHEYLLHQILAISAYHLLHTQRPLRNAKYLQRAAFHHDASLRGLRTALSEEINPDNATPMFVASCYLMSITYASRRYVNHDEMGSDPLEDVVSIFSLYRGISAVNSRTSALLETDMYRKVFGQAEGAVPVEAPWLRDFQSSLEHLRSQIAVLESLEEQTRSIVLDGIRSLLTVTSPDDRAPSVIIAAMELSILFRWPYNVSDAFLVLLRAREPAASAVFLYYVAAMTHAEKHRWYLKGWSSTLAKSVLRDLQNTAWLDLAGWALNVIESTPTSPVP